MGVYYPQGVMTLRVRLEDFGDTNNPKFQQLHVFTIVCKRISVQLNSYLEADTFEAEIDYKSFPFDPRAIRSVGVSIYIEDRKGLFRTNNALNLLTPSEENIVFQGFADEDKITLSEESRVVRLEGRDFTSLLIDREYTGKAIVKTLPLDLAIQDLLDAFEDTKEIRIDNQTGSTLPIISQYTSSKDGEANFQNGRRGKSYWDQIQAFIEQAGLIGYISLDTLVLSKPRILYDDSKPKLFVYGDNISNLEFNRKLGRQKGFNIRVLSLNLESKAVIDATIPKEAYDDWVKAIGIRKDDIKVPVIKPNGDKGEDKIAPFLTFRLANIVSKPQLIEIGQKIFEEVGRQQIEGSLETKEMLLCEKNEQGDGVDRFNTTKLRVGTPIEIDINQGDLEGLPALLKVEGKEDPQAQAARKNRVRKFLIANCYDVVVAEALSEALTRFTTPFFTKSVEFKLDQENGFSVRLDFINFITLPTNLANRTGVTSG